MANSKKATTDVKSGVPGDTYKGLLPEAPKKTVEQVDKANTPSSRAKAPGATRI